MRKSHRRPRNNQDFEILCLKLLRAHWQCQELQLYATRGQCQNGVDIIDVSSQVPLRAAQCKLREEKKIIQRSTIEHEINQARSFDPPLGRYVIMTTGKVGSQVHDLLIEINRKHREEKLFVVEVFDWKCIEELLDEYLHVRDWYENDPKLTQLRRLESKIDNMSGVIEGESSRYRINDNNDIFHTQIDEARDFIRKGQFQLARQLLHKLKDRGGEDLNSRHKFRLLTNLGVLESLTKHPTRAAAFYLEAKTHQPSDEIACSNESTAYLMLGQRAEAFEIASKLREEFPNSARVLRVFIQSAPESMTMEDLQESVPKILLHEKDVVVALTRRALDCGEIGIAEEIINTATNLENRASWSWLLLGEAIFRAEVSNSFRTYGDGSFCDRERLRAAEDAFGQALNLSTGNGYTFEIVEALLNRSQTRFLLDKNAEARSDLLEARRIAPDNPRIVETYSELLRLDGKINEAIEHLRSVGQEELSEHSRLMLGLMLMDRGAVGDYRTGEDLFFAVALSATELAEDMREHAIEVGLEACAIQNRLDAGERFLEELPEGVLSEVSFKTLTARLHLLKGEQHEASKYAGEALELINATTTVFEVRRLARLFSAMGRFNDALPLWQRIAVPKVLSQDTRYLLDCASRLNRHEVLLNTFGKLREEGAIDRTLLDNELSLLVMYDTEKALRILDEEIKQRSDDEELKLKRSMLGLALDRDDLVDRNPMSVPRAEDVEPSTARDAVLILGKIGQEHYAVQYAYNVIRRNFDNPDGHKVFLHALSPFANKPILEEPDRVEVGSAVRYNEQGVSTQQWIIVEDSPDINSQLPELELRTDHAISKAMMGKKAGETFILAKGFQDRIGKILEIKNKYVYRYQDCLAQWQVRFPDVPYIQTARIETKESEEHGSKPKFDEFLQLTDKYQDQLERHKNIYKEKPLSIHMFGSQFNKTTFDALHYLALSPQVSIKCCIGSAEEREEAARHFKLCNRVILDMSAISTLFLLNRLGILECDDIDFVVSQSTVNEIRRMIANESFFYSKESGTLVKTESGYAFWEMTAEQQISRVNSLRQLVRLLESNCHIGSGELLAAMKPGKRSILINGFGQHGAEAISLSVQPGAVLWTDDLVQAFVAQNEYGVSRVWTQFVVKACADSGILDSKIYLDVSARLLGYGFHFTSNNPQIMMKSGVIGDWKVHEWPFSQVLASIGDENVELSDMLYLVVQFLRLVYQESLKPQTRRNVTINLLEHLAKRAGGVDGILNLQKALPTIFGLNVVGLVDVVEDINAWLSARLA